LFYQFIYATSTQAAFAAKLEINQIIRGKADYARISPMHEGAKRCIEKGRKYVRMYFIKASIGYRPQNDTKRRNASLREEDVPPKRIANLCKKQIYFTCLPFKISDLLIQARHFTS